MKARIILFSDTHEPASLESWRALFDKRALGLVNSRLIRKNRYDRDLLPRAVDLILKDPPDLVLFTGDAVSCGQPGEFVRALEMFRPLISSGIPLVCIPGNHDAYVNDAVCRKALEDFTLAVSRGKHPLDSYPFAVDFPLFRVLAIDCARPVDPVMSCGLMMSKTRRFLQEEAARKDRRPLICAGHFPILLHRGMLNFRRRLFGASEAAELLRSGKIDLSLCGHVHRPEAQLDDRGRGEIIAGSLTKYGTLAEITYDSGADKFSLRRISLRG
ncbi:MAG: metallophosphoesterase [Lentisphaeria bacterium]|nr:metallophosphoesterase [Lentisphaeria bacterium]